MKRFSAFLLIGIAALPVGAQSWLPDHALVHTAIDAQPEVRAARSEADAARARARARAVGPYEFEATVVAQRRDASDPAVGNAGYAEWEGQIGRRIRLPGKAALDREIGSHEVDAAELRLDDARHQAARRLLSRWMDWLRASARDTEAVARADSLQRERAAVARRVELGDAARKDLDLVDMELAQAHAQSVATRSALDAAIEAIRVDFPTLPLPANAPDIGDVAELTGTPEDWRSLIERRSHEIGAAEADAAQQDALAARARADRRPDPSIGLRLLDERGGSEHALGLVLSVPIGGRHRAATADAEQAIADARRATSDAVRRDVLRDAAEAVRDAKARRAQWRAEQAALAAGTAASRRVKRGWELGESSMGEWLAAERMRAQIALTEATARVDAEAARLRVLVDSHELWHDE